jgi:hypothetical protein
VTSRTGWRAWSLAAAAAAGMGAVLAALSLAVVGGRGTAAGWAAVPTRFFAQATADVAPETVRAQLQSRDNSCGLAALAYLMSYLGMPTREGELLPVARLGVDGISMADLAVVARQRGLLAWGELQNFDALRETPKPVIAHIRDDHYVVVLSVGRLGVDCFDPSQGYVRIPEVDFRKVWRGYALVVRFPHLQDFSP